MPFSFFCGVLRHSRYASLGELAMGSIFLSRLRRSSCAAVIAAMSSAGIGGALAQDISEAQQFLLTYRCAVVERLKIVHATVRPKDRYFIFSLKREKQAYVQCLFLPNEPRMLCEASSGYYLSKPGEPPSTWQVPADRLAELARLGFSTDGSQGNYQRMLDLDAGVDFVGIADLILSAIYYGYGARLGTPMEWNAPLVPKTDDAEARCTPLG